MSGIRAVKRALALTPQGRRWLAIYWRGHFDFCYHQGVWWVQWR